MERLAVAPLVMEGWARRRRRARQLLDRHGFAAQLLRLYGALLDVQERAFLATLDDAPSPSVLPAYVAGQVMKDILAATVVAGPPALAEAVQERLASGDATAFVAAWLAGEPQPPVEQYLARAASAPVLEALGPAAAEACAHRGGDAGCPRCGGLPQVSYFSESPEALVTSPRMLQCCRCAESWVHPRMTCVACGEQTTAKLPIFADAERFAHLRADGCESCRRYLIAVDGRKDPAVVPMVDELVALPLDLDARERGFAKIAPNLMGI